jgi:hypothetical protein
MVGHLGFICYSSCSARLMSAGLSTWPTSAAQWSSPRRGPSKCTRPSCLGNATRSTDGASHSTSQTGPRPCAGSFSEGLPLKVFAPTSNHRLTAVAEMPRLLPEKEAARAVGIDVATFRAWVSSGRLPGPISECDKFDLKAIDAALDRISGLGSPANALDAWRAKGAGGKCA